ncbi:hypothetical protein GEMRC1_006742 [Eukaryota sp. GEM-RC1]
MATLLVFFSLFTIVFCRSHWCVDVLPSPDSSSPVVMLIPETDYYLRIRVCTNNQPSPQLTSHLLGVGSSPRVTVQDGLLSLSSDFLERSTSLLSSSWLLPFSAELPGYISLYIHSPSFGSVNFAQVEASFTYLTISSLFSRTYQYLYVLLFLRFLFPFLLSILATLLSPLFVHLI